MWSLYQRVFESASTIDDKVAYLISSKYLRNVCMDKNYETLLPEKIHELLGCGATRCEGLYLLEMTLHQCHDLISVLWVPKLNEVLKSSDPSNAKGLACNILSFIVVNTPKATSRSEIVDYFGPVVKVIFENADDSEWVVEALNFLAACAQRFPLVFVPQKLDRFKSFLMRKMSSSSTKCNEAVASCFAALPACIARNNDKDYGVKWLNQFEMTLNTLHKIMNNVLCNFSDTVRDTSEDDTNLTLPLVDATSQLAETRQFSCLCRCLAKMLCSETNVAVQIPILNTLECAFRILCIEDLNKKHSLATDDFILLSLLPLMQNSALVVLEAIILNFSCNLVKYANYIASKFERAIRATSENSLVVGFLPRLRSSLWRVLNIWLKSAGHNASLHIVKFHAIIDELLQDTLLNDMKSEDKRIKNKTLKAKEKTMAFVEMNQKHVSDLSWVAVCAEALEALTQIIYIEGRSLEMFCVDKIQSVAIRVSTRVYSAKEYPFPYNHEQCRLGMYELLFSLVVNTEATDVQVTMSAIGLFNAGLKDQSYEVRGVSLKFLCALQKVLHPKKPYPVRLERVPSSHDNLVLNVVENSVNTGWENKQSWMTDNVPTVSAPCGDIKTYQEGNQSDIEMNNGEFIHTEAFSPQHYSKRSVKPHCNGENDILVLRNSSQSNEEESDEDVEEEQCYDEEIQSDTQRMRENYIPSNVPLQNMSSSVSTLNEPSNVSHQEYEELRLEEKYNQAKLLRNCSSRNFHQTNACSLTGDKMASTSTHKPLPENGLYGYEEGMEDEEGDDDEEETEVFATDRTSLQYYNSHAKKRKICNEEEEVEEEEVEEEEEDEEEEEEEDGDDEEEVEDEEDDEIQEQEVKSESVAEVEQDQEEKETEQSSEKQIISSEATS